MQNFVGCCANSSCAARALICGTSCGPLMHCATQASRVNRASRHADTFSRLDHRRFAFPQGQCRIAGAAIPVLVRNQPEIPAGKILYARSRTEMARQASIEKRSLSELLSRIAAARLCEAQGWQMP